MNKTPLILGAVMVLIVGAATILMRDQQVYQTQVLQQQEVTAGPTEESVENCRLLSEQAANECYQRLAIAEQDSEICEEISTTSQREVCRREVELSQ